MWWRGCKEYYFLWLVIRTWPERSIGFKIDKLEKKKRKISRLCEWERWYLVFMVNNSQDGTRSIGFNIEKKIISCICEWTRWQCLWLIVRIRAEVLGSKLMKKSEIIYCMCWLIEKAIFSWLVIITGPEWSSSRSINLKQ